MKKLLSTVITFSLMSVCATSIWAQSTGINGLGKSTVTCIDKDGDGYGVGPGCVAPDADDNDPSVYSAAQAIAKYGTVNGFLTHLGYNPLRTWYLDSVHGNDATCIANSSASSCATWTHISPLLAVGDLVLFRAGSYPAIGTLPISGTLNNPIILMAYPGEAVTISTTTTGDGIGLVNISNAIIDGLKITSPGSTAQDGISGGTYCGAGAACGSTILSSNIAIRHCEIYQTYWGIISNNISNWLIEENVLHDSFGEHNIYLGANLHVTIPSANVTVRRNILYNSALGTGNGVQFNGRVTNLVVEQNLIYNNGLSGISLLQGVSNSFIRNNVVFGNARNSLIIFNYNGDCYPNTSSSLICPFDQTGNLIENNTFYTGAFDRTGTAISQAGVLIANGSTGKLGNLGGNTFRNNIIWGASTNVAGSYSPVVFQDKSPNYLASSVFQNNIFWPQDGTNLVIAFGPGSSFGYQGYTCSAVASLTTMSGCLNSNPDVSAANTAWYAQAANYNFAPLAGSPAVAAGSTTAAPTTDITGAVRSNPPTIGAYELRQSTSALTVTMASPLSGAVLSGVVDLSASVSDINTISGVQFQVDGANVGSLVTGVGPSYKMSWNAASVTNGAHTLAAIAKDTAGNTAGATVAVTVNNTVGPVLSGVTATSITSSTATITWATSTLSDSQVSYGATSAYGLTTGLATALVTAHSVNVSGLTPSTTYHYQAQSRDAAGNLGKSGDFTFATAAQTSTGIALPLNSWTMVATHGLPVQAVGWEKLVYSSAVKKAVMLGDYHQMGTEPNNALIAYDFAANRWDIMDMGGLFHEENMPEAGHSVGMFTYNPNQNSYIYYCCGSGSNEPENPWHTWWFDPIGQVGRDKHTAPKPGLTIEGGAAFDVAHNVLVFFDGGAGTWIYDPVANTWTQQNPKGTPPPVGLKLAMMAYNSAQQKVYLFGGRVGYGTGATFYNNLYTYDVPSSTWTSLSPSGPLPPGREKAGFAYDSTNKVFLLYGGHNDSGVSNPVLNDTWVYDPTANAWTQLNPGQTPPATDTSFERLAYDPDDNAFVMVLEGSGGFADGSWGSYGIQTWIFRYQGNGPNPGTSSPSFLPSSGSINRNAAGWAKEPSVTASGSTAYSAWIETGAPFDTSDAAWSHVYVSQLVGGVWTPLGGSFNSINSELTTTSGHSESHSPSIAAIGGTPWVSYYQATTDNSSPSPAQIYAKKWNGSTWAGGPIGLVHNAAAVYQGRSQIVGVGGTPYIAFLEVDKTTWPQQAFAYVKQWNGSQWVLVGNGPLNRNVGTITTTPLSFADSISTASDGTNAYVAWTEYTSDSGELNQTPPQVYVSRWNGTQWVAIGGSLNTNPGNWAYDASVTYFNGQPYVAWVERSQGGNAQLFVKTFNGSNWALVGSGTLNRNSITGWAFRPNLVGDSSGLYLAWVEQSTSGQRAQTYVSKLSGTTWTALGSSLNTDPVSGSAQRASVAVVTGSPVAAWGEVKFGSMRQIFVKQWNGSTWVPPTGSPAGSLCDLNGDGVVNGLDVQIAIDQALGLAACTTADLQQNGICSIIDVERVVVASGGGACRTGP